MKTTRKTVIKKPAVKKMSTGGTTKKISYGGIKPKALKKAALGMSMGSSGTDDSECSGYPPKRGCGKVTKFKTKSRRKSGNNSPKGMGLFTGY
jgi:hypothetical protein